MKTGVGVQKGDALQRSEMRSGPVKIRRITTARPDIYDLVHPSFTLAQVEVLDIFYTDTLASGALAFDMQNPQTGNTEIFRFLVPPSWQAGGGKVWAVNFNLERLP